MGWRRAEFKGKKVWIEVDAKGEPKAAAAEEKAPEPEPVAEPEPGDVKYPKWSEEALAAARPRASRAAARRADGTKRADGAQAHQQGP